MDSRIAAAWACRRSSPVRRRQLARPEGDCAARVLYGEAAECAGAGQVLAQTARLAGEVDRVQQRELRGSSKSTERREGVAGAGSGGERRDGKAGARRARFASFSRIQRQARCVRLAAAVRSAATVAYGAHAAQAAAAPRGSSTCSRQQRAARGGARARARGKVFVRGA